MVDDDNVVLTFSAKFSLNFCRSVSPNNQVTNNLSNLFNSTSVYIVLVMKTGQHERKRGRSKKVKSKEVSMKMTTCMSVCVYFTSWISVVDGDDDAG